MTDVTVYPGMEQRQQDPGCPSLLEIARCEAGDLPDGLRATLHAHAVGCARCGGILSVIECARCTLLGTRPHQRCRNAHRAATLLLARVEKERLSRC